MSIGQRFVADVMLGRLARWLRVLGLDVHYDPALDDGALVDLAVGDGRTILTRDRRLVERRLAKNHILIRSDVLDEQLLQLAQEVSLGGDGDSAFGRCIDCNSPFEALAIEEARRRVPPYVARTQARFCYCRECDRVFWRATHVREMEERLRRLGLWVAHE